LKGAGLELLQLFIAQQAKMVCRDDRLSWGWFVEPPLLAPGL
jgi:hypothetical protein